MNYCPQCATSLITRTEGEMPRPVCPAADCGFIHWDNPVPVVAAVVEHEGRIVLARNKAWTTPFFALITGFLEKTDVSPQEAIRREVKEELGLDATAAHFIGHYRFERQNQLIIAFHVPATGTIVLGEELAEYRCFEPGQVRTWPVATGLALHDWLVSQGHQPTMLGS